VRILARAKLNLHLGILAREDSGWHQIETIFCRLELADELDIHTGDAGVRLTLDGPDLGPPDRNLAVRAAHAFLGAAGVAGGVDIHLVKRIPAGAGLGGGSSDAAATLLALNQLHGEPLDPEALLELGAALGSDVPFFVADTALALAWGRGERLLPLDALPRAQVLLAIPPFRISTPDAYRRLDDAAHGQVGPAPRLHRGGDYQTWSSFALGASNVFEDVLFPHYPQLARLKAALRAAGAFLALMTGSGSAVFGLFPDADALHAAHDRLRAAFGDVSFIETCTDGGERADLLG
jgi:4-diphosphocytidyl-2-C-methyl-D-erythritol kinase